MKGRPGTWPGASSVDPGLTRLGQDLRSDHALEGEAAVDHRGSDFKNQVGQGRPG